MNDIILKLSVNVVIPRQTKKHLFLICSPSVLFFGKLLKLTQMLGVTLTSNLFGKTLIYVSYLIFLSLVLIHFLFFLQKFKDIALFISHVNYIKFKIKTKGPNDL